MRRKILTLILTVFTFLTAITLNITSVNAQTESYYAECEGLTGQALLEKLAEITLENHKNYTSYSSLTTSLKYTDPDPNKSGAILDFYSRISTTSWNREHVWPKSLSGGLYGTSGAGSDIHHIRPTINNINSTRSNKKFTDFDMIGMEGNPYYYENVLTAYQTSSYWEPLDNVKGDTARIVMYMYMHYNKPDIKANSNNSRAGNMYITNIVYGGGSTQDAWDILLAWNNLDPVDAYEANRNEYCTTVTGTRNPFIDYPEFADAIWGNGEAVNPDDNTGNNPSTPAPDTPITPEPETPVQPDVPTPSGEAAVLVEDASNLRVNDQIIIAAKNSDYALGTTQNKNNRASVNVTKNTPYITYGADTQIITLTQGTKSNTFGLYVGDGYLCSASSSSNYLKTETSLTVNSSWNISVTNGSAKIVSQGSYSRNTIRFNTQNNLKLFACYASGQEDVEIYKLINNTIAPENPEDDEKDNYIDEVTSLFETYYNNGTYIKDTLINLTPSAKEKLVKYFHAQVNVLQRTTYYKNNELWMSRGDGHYSYYGTNSQGLTNAATNTPNVTPEEVKLAIPGTTMLDYFTTLVNLKNKTTAVWNKENGVYYTTDEVVLRQYLDFTAPCLLPEIFESGYYTYDKATLEVIDGSLIMKLYVVKDNENDLTNIERILSEASISISDYTLLENATNDVLNLNNTTINSNYNLPTTVGGVNVSWSGENVEGNVLKYISPSIETTNTLTATLTIGELTEVVTINFIQKKYVAPTPDSYEYTEFSSSDLAIFNEYIGYTIPFVENDLYEVIWSSEFNAVNFYTYGNTVSDYNNYLTLLEKAGFKSAGSYDYDDVTWYSYQKNGNYMDIAAYDSEGIYVIDIYVYVPTNSGGTDVPTQPSNPKYSTLYFNELANRVSYSGIKQVWTNGIITLTNAGSCGDYYNPVRLYSGSNVEISGENITSIVFSCAPKTSDKYYAEILFDSLSDLYINVYMSGDTVTLTLDNAINLVEFNMVAQTRLVSITVYTE